MHAGECCRKSSGGIPIRVLTPDSRAASRRLGRRLERGVTGDSQLTTVALMAAEFSPDRSGVEIFAGSRLVRLAPSLLAWPPPQEFTGCTLTITMPHRSGSYFHLHLISDATGETLTTVARA